MQDITFRRSPFFFVGDKAKLLSQLLPKVPQNINTYVEPFLGGGSLSLNVQANKYVLSDISLPLIQMHQRLRELALAGNLLNTVCQRIERHGFTCTYLGISAPPHLISKYPKTYFAEANRDAFLKLRLSVNNSRVRNPLDLYILVIYGFNRMLRFNRAGEFNIPVGNVDFNSRTAAALADFQEFHRSRKQVSFVPKGFQDLVGGLKLGSSDFVYLDPPYLITQAEYNLRWTLAEDQALFTLFETLDAQGVRVAMSNVLQYRDRLNLPLQCWARRFQLLEVSSNYINRFDNRQKVIREVLITNY